MVGVGASGEALLASGGELAQGGLDGVDLLAGGQDIEGVQLLGQAGAVGVGENVGVVAQEPT